VGDSSRADVAVRSAAEARRLLGSVLRVVQAAASTAPSESLRDQMYGVAEAVADVSSTLYVLEKQPAEPAQGLVRLDGALAGLRKALSLLQSPREPMPGLEDCTESIAQALAVLYAAGRAEQRSSLRPAGAVDEAAAQVPRVALEQATRSRRRLVVVDSSDSLPQVPPAPVPVAEPVVPLVTRTSPPAAEAAMPLVAKEAAVPLVTRTASGRPAPSSVRPAPEPDGTVPLTRRSRRAAERAFIDVDVGFVSDSNFYAGLSMDMSAGGLFVATYQIRPVGTPVMLSFVLPDGTTVTVAGEVRWVRDPRSGEAIPGMGIAFRGLEGADLEAVQRFCRKREPMYFDDEV
jgi:uncharacterized protein (TIGR02266 family)